MSKIDETIDKWIEEMFQEELKKAAKLGVMISLKIWTEALSRIEEFKTNGKEKQHPKHPIL